MGLYLGCALGRSATGGDVVTALLCGLAIGWLLSEFI